MQKNVGKHIKSLNLGYLEQLKEMEIDVYNMQGTLLDNHTIKLVDKDGKEITKTAMYFCIAVGGRPRYLNLPNIKELAITSDDIFWLKKSPGKTLVVGASYVALECAGFLTNFGL